MTHHDPEPPAGQQVNLALAASWLGGMHPLSITVELRQDGTPSGLIIDAGWGAGVKDTRPVFEALGLHDPALATWPGPEGRTQVVIDDTTTTDTDAGEALDDGLGRLGIPVTITVDTPAADQDTTVGEPTGQTADADVIDLDGYHTHHHTDAAVPDEATTAEATTGEASADEAEDHVGIDAAVADDDGYGS